MDKTFSPSQITYAEAVGFSRFRFHRKRTASSFRFHIPVFSTLADEFGGFGAVFGTALKERNQTIGNKKHGGISAYRKAFLLFWQWIFNEKTEEIWSWLFFTTLFSWILNFIINFNNGFTSTLAALDSNLVANLGLRKYSPSFICTSAACNSRLSWWAVWGWRLKRYGSSWWISFFDNRKCDWFKTLKCEYFEAWEIWQAYMHSIDL